jgi:HK97 family phage portal protein
MKWFTGLFRKAASLFSFVPEWVRHSFSLISYSRLIREGYRVNSAVSACVTTLAFSFPEPPLLAGYDEEGRFVPDYNHPIMKLIRNPNPDMGEAEMMQFAITYAPTGGNCYFWKQRSASGKVVYLWPFNDGQISPAPGHNTSEGFVAFYEYDSGDSKKIQIPKNDVIQWKWMIDPLQPAKGIGAIELSAREVDKDNEASSYIFSLLKNNAVPSVVITKEEDDDSTQEEVDRMGRQWIQKHGKGEPAFISHGMKVEQMGYDLHKLAAETLADIPESRIAANFRVPPSVAGLNVGIKRSDYGDVAARRAFTETTLIPLWRSLASELLNGLKDEYPGLPGNFTLQFDLRRVGALQEEESKRWDRLTLAFDRGAITREMMKQMLGLKAEPGDKVYKVSLATEFLPADGSGEVLRNNEPKKQAWMRAETKAQRRSVTSSLLDIRKKLAPKMSASVGAYFSGLAGRVVDRAGKKSVISYQLSVKKLPDADDLLNDSDKQELETLVKRFYVEVARLSWDTWNVALGVEKAFDLNDPAVTRTLKMAGKHAEDIQGETLQALREALQYGSENGWGIDQLVRGDDTHPGLRDIVEETYKNRSRAVAISELGQAQNTATAERYKGAGVAKVEILDGGADDSAPACDLANGQIWTVELFEANTLQHPNCSRAAAPYFGDDEAETTWSYAFGDRG